MRLLGLATALLLPMGALSLGVPPTAGGGPPALPPNWVAYQDPSLGKAYVSTAALPRRADWALQGYFVSELCL